MDQHDSPWTSEHSMLRSMAASGLPSHACAVGESEASTVAMAVRLASESIRAQGECVLHGKKRWLALVQAALSDAGYDVPKLVDEGAVVFASQAQPVADAGEGGSAGEGLAPTSSLGRSAVLHVASIVSRASGHVDILDHEALLGYSTGISADQVVCLYDRDFFEPSEIKRAIYAHPLVIVDDAVHVNYHFTPVEHAIVRAELDGVVEGLLDSLDAPPTSRAHTVASGTDARLESAESISAALAQEVARRANSQRALRESERLHRALFEMSPNCEFVHSDGVIVLANRAAASIVGLDDPADVVGRPVASFVHPNSIPSVTGRVKWMYETGQAAPVTQEQFLRADGTEFLADVLAAPIMFQDQPAIQVIMTDITSRTQLATEMEFRSFLLDSATDSIVVQDAETGVALYVNEAACTLHGRTREELLARTGADWIPEDELLRTPQRRPTSLREQGMIYETEVSRADGTSVPVEVHATAIPYGERKVIVRVGRDITERQLAELTIENMAFFDSLTKLANRTLFLDRLGIAVAQARRTGTGLAVMFLDLDHFKTVNDTLGHATGDQLLQLVGSRLENEVRAGDTVARLGGDEFTLLLPGVATSDEAEHVAAKVLEVVAEPFMLHDQEIHATASIGIALLQQDDTADVLLNNADTAMYRAKALGRGSCQVFSASMHARVSDRFELRNDLRHALERGELRVDYQPIFRVSDRAIVGAEALMRWDHPQRGAVSPTDFIPLAEESGLIVTLGEWILLEAASAAQQWMGIGEESVRVSVNLSPRQLLAGGLVSAITKALVRSKLPAQLLELEVTENVAMIRGAGVTRAFEELRALGVGIAIDDFGMGYSSLDYLRRYPIGTLKIDRSFVGEVEVDNHSRAIAKTVVVLAKTLGLNVVAEGVETQHQLDFLVDCGCVEAQGYLLGMPMPAEEFAQLLAESARGVVVDL